MRTSTGSASCTGKLPPATRHGKHVDKGFIQAETLVAQTQGVKFRVSIFGLFAILYLSDAERIKSPVNTMNPDWGPSSVHTHDNGTQPPSLPYYFSLIGPYLHSKRFAHGILQAWTY